MADAGKAVAPSGKLHVARISWNSRRVLHRIHHEHYPGEVFNPGIAGNARFSPIKDSAGALIPTLYAGDAFECAAMETVFHDVPHLAGFKSYDKAKLAGQLYTQLKAGHDLVLADLGSKALRKLGIRRDQLIDTEKDQYPMTRKWAEAIHAQEPDIQGLCWTSRQDDSAKAVVLFGDRIPAGELVPMSTSTSVVKDAVCYSALLALAEHIGVYIVPGKA